MQMLVPEGHYTLHRVVFETDSQSGSSSSPPLRGRGGGNAVPK